MLDYESDDGVPIDNVNFDIRGGTTTATGEYEAVGKFADGSGFYTCSATFITRTAALTAAHCVNDYDPGTETCDEGTLDDEGFFEFTDVLPVGSSTRGDHSLWGEVLVHPGYCDSESGHVNDYAVLRFTDDMTGAQVYADDVVQVSPIKVASSVPFEDTVTLVGYGQADQSGGDDCDGAGYGTKRKVDGEVDGWFTYGDPSLGKTIQVIDSTLGGCEGDSGGPMIKDGKVVGVGSTMKTTESNYDATDEAWDWLQQAACPYFESSEPTTSFCNDPLCVCATPEGDCDSNSHCVSGSKCTHDTGNVVGLPTYYDQCWDTDWVVTAYAGQNYSGSSQDFVLGIWTNSPNEINRVGNNTISSIKVPPAHRAWLCDTAPIFSPCQAYDDDTTYVGATLDNKASWVEVEPGVTVYDLTSYGGTWQTFTEGQHEVADLDIIGNDKVSSLRAAPGIWVKLWTEGSCWGQNSEAFWGDVPDVGSGVNNKTSCVEVKHGASIYSDHDYGGSHEAFPAGTYDDADFTVLADDSASSLIVAPGMQVEICENSNGTGTCKTFTGWIPNVGHQINDKTSWVEVTSL